MELNLSYKDVSKMKSLTDKSFDPIKDAPYERHQHIPFSLVAHACQIIEECKGEKSQDLVKEILANVFRTAICLKPAELIPLFYFFICRLGPEYEGIETGVGNEMVVNAVTQACGKSKTKIREEVKKIGDLGTVAAESKGSIKSLASFFKPKTPKIDKSMTVLRVFETFMSIAKRKGSSSVGDKTNSIMKLFTDSKPEEVKYIIRWLEGHLKIGAAEKTVVSALARAFTYTPGDPKNFPPSILNYRKKKGETRFNEREAELDETIKEAVCVFPNYDKMIEALLELGDSHVEELPKKCYMRVGIPVKPMLAKPTTGVNVILKRFDGIKFTCEYKYDGFRGQIHYQKQDPDDPTKKKIGIFSRNLENMTETYPDAIQYLSENVDEKVDNFIIDCEIVPYDIRNKKILPFQLLTTRSRKNVDIKDVEIQVCLFLFDILYLNDQNDIIKKTFKERRDIMKATFPEEEGKLMYAVSKDAEKFEEIEEFLNDSIKDSCEGLMVKTLEENSTYHPSKRSFNWLKLKKDYLETSLGDSLDLVVVGADYGKGKRTGFYGSFLFACFDEDAEVFQTLVKAGTGFTDEDLKKMHEVLNELETTDPDPRIKYKEKNIDTWFTPKLVLEIKAADLTISPTYMAAHGRGEEDKGISLRFPRFIRVRDDKKPEDCSTSDQIYSMYRSQQAVAQNDICFDDY
ncbi:unnamed protein product [Moneuplotes crassus]|uniref:DNA ligase n=2 Tax=Euplotes crassus TaxID=5936 RepID=A0AAD2DA41_EUPCR|nr:unnamed protein product [Moneuplotes crassus]